MIRNSFLLVCIASFFAACGSSGEKELDSPTRGQINMSVDENVQAITEELVEVFESSYTDAFLMTSYKNEKGVVSDLYNDSCRLAIMTRKLNKDELSYFEGQLKFGVEQIKIASDAIVFVVNKTNPDSAFTKATIRKMLLGQDTAWSQISTESQLGRIDVVFDNGASSNLRFLTDSLMDGRKPGANVFAMSNPDSVIAYVNRTPGAVGVIGLNAIGEKNSEAAMNRRKQITVCAIGADSVSAWKPSQSTIVTRQYPLVREIWIIKIGKRSGLGTGFASFALGERGQLIIQHAGLAPAAPAERKIELTTY